MKHFLLFITLAGLFAGINSCSSTQHASTTRSRTVSANSIQETSSVADLVVEETKVTGTSDEKDISEDNAKNLAVYDAIKKVNADVLVEPSYEIEKSDHRISVTVQGFPGFYKHFRRPSSEDSLVLGWKKIVKPTAPKTRIVTRSSSTTSSVDTEKPSIFSFNQPTRPIQSPNAPAITSSDAWQQYQRYLHKGRKQLGWGVTLLATGIILDGCSVITDDVGLITMLSVGSTALVLGAILTPVGASNLAKAKRIKRQNGLGTVSIGFTPHIDLRNDKFGGGLAMRF